VAASMQIALRGEIGGLQSIKRDFLGIPVVLAWQAVAPKEFPYAEGWSAKGYDAFYAAVKSALEGYMNDDWLFINVHQHFLHDPKPYIGTHLGNEGHIAVADLIAERMAPLVRQVAKRRFVERH